MKFSQIIDETSKKYISVLSPSSSAEAEIATVQQWLHGNAQMMQEKLSTEGAILLRGFNVNNASDFESVAKSFTPQLGSEYLGTSPRTRQTNAVYTSTEFPAYFPAMQHCEMSFLTNPPETLFFYCQTQPQKGGETVICDFSTVWESIDSRIREKFSKLGVKHIRNYKPYKNKFNPFQLKTWIEMFNTDQRDIAAQKALESGSVPVWKGDTLQLVNEIPAYRVHPENQKEVWFNHLMSFSLVAPRIEAWKIFLHQKTLRSLGVFLALSVLVAIQNLFVAPSDQAMATLFGNERRIPRRIIRHVHDVMWRNSFFHKWQTHDILILDNRFMSHNRMPFYGPRKILVCWA